MTTSTRNRRASPINHLTASDTFADLWDAATEPKALSATTLSGASRTWRKINKYLNEPLGYQNRTEAEETLERLGIGYTCGEYNSRSFTYID